MKSIFTAAVLAAAAFTLTACDEPVQRTVIPSPADQNAYEPVPQPKPLPPQDSYNPGQPQGYAQPGQPAAVLPNPSIHNEDAFLAAYEAHRNPRIMVWVNRTITGDPVPQDKLQEITRASATSDAAGNQIYRDATLTTTSGKYDDVGASSADYDLIEASVAKYFDNSGKVQIQDSEAARGKLDREKTLRLENGDPAAVRLIGVELQQDIIIRITAQPTHQASFGNAIRLNAKAISTTNARNLGVEFVDMPLPMSKTNITIYTRYLSESLMGEMAKKWSLPPVFDPIEVRIYKAATVDDTLKIRKWLQQTRNVQSVQSRGATGSSETAYANFAVAYQGAPEDLYADLKDAIGASQGLKAVDLQNNTINLEVTGGLNLVTTTRKSETTTTVETHTTEEKIIDPINPAPPPAPANTDSLPLPPPPPSPTDTTPVTPASDTTPPAPPSSEPLLPQPSH